MDKKIIAVLNNDFSDISRDELIAILNVIGYYLDSPNNSDGIRISDYIKDDKVKKDILTYQKIIELIQSEIMKKEQEETKSEEIVKVVVTEEKPSDYLPPLDSEHIADEKTKVVVTEEEPSDYLPPLDSKHIADEKTKEVVANYEKFALTEGTKKILIEETIKRLREHFDLLYRNDSEINKSDSKNSMNDYLEMLMGVNLNDMVLKYTKAKTMKDLLDETSQYTNNGGMVK